MPPFPAIGPSSSTPAPAPLADATAPAPVTSVLPGLSLTLVTSSGGIEGPGGGIHVHLEHPTIGPEDIPLNECLQQVESLGHAPVAILVRAEAVNELAEGTRALGQAMQDDPPLDAPTAAELAASYEGQALVIERQIRDVIENSTYPNFNDFLKELVKVAQDLREAATKTKLAAIQANHSLMIAAADQMVIAAEKAQDSREKQIAADKKEAIGQIVGGIASIAFAWCAPLAQGANSLITGSFNASTTGMKTESSTLQFESDMANVAKQRLEAAAKLIESEVQIAEDLREIAKGLRDMILKLYQDFISSRSQVLQRANV